MITKRADLLPGEQVWCPGRSASGSVLWEHEFGVLVRFSGDPRRTYRYNEQGYPLLRHGAEVDLQGSRLRVLETVPPELRVRAALAHAYTNLDGLLSDVRDRGRELSTAKPPTREDAYLEAHKALGMAKEALNDMGRLLGV